MVKTYHDRFNQALERRGFILFDYAPAKIGNTRLPTGYRRVLPFFENAAIRESRKANYTNTKIFLRNEPVRLYTGSMPRKFSIKLHYSLAHMAAMLPGDTFYYLFAKDNADAQLMATEFKTVRERLNTQINFDLGTPGHKQIPSLNAAKDAMADRGSSQEGPVGPVPDSGNDGVWNFMVLEAMSTSKRSLEYLGIVQYVLNLIRASVTSTEQNPKKGPPIAILKYGSMYDGVPCIVKDYKISQVENAGYDTKSLFSNRIAVELNLEEFRNVHGWLHGTPEVTSSLPGWDSILTNGGVDPGLESASHLKWGHFYKNLE
jgi:hypothetical protein